MSTRILLVEDEATISEPLAENLGRDGFEAEVAPTLAGAREAFRREAPDLVLLDVMLPRWRRPRSRAGDPQESDVPIVMLTARGRRSIGCSESSSARTTTSSSPSRRGSSRPEPSCGAAARDQKSPIEIGALRLDPTSRTVTKDDESLEMAAREFDLLHLLS
jgi:DNA-binding response OmpR family regulator